MKKYIPLFGAILFVLIIGFLISCVTTGAIKADSTSQLPTIARKYEERFQKTQIGIEVDSFLLLWPEVYPVGENAGIIAYEFKDIQLYYTSHDENIGVFWTVSIPTHEYTQIVWFYFSEGKLIKWGNDRDWPR